MEEYETSNTRNSNTSKIKENKIKKRKNQTYRSPLLPSKSAALLAQTTWHGTPQDRATRQTVKQLCANGPHRTVGPNMQKEKPKR